MSEEETAVADLAPGDMFVRDVPTGLRRGSRTARTYTVTGHGERRGIPYLLVRSDVQGDGSFAYADLPPALVVTR